MRLWIKGRWQSNQGVVCGHKERLRWRCLFIATAVALVPVAQALELTGAVGYNYRQQQEISSPLTVSGTGTSSHQIALDLGLSTPIIAPWLARLSVDASFALDKTDFQRTAQSQQSTLQSGRVSLGVLPDSHTPFTAFYSVSDTRVDQPAVQDLPVTLSGQDYIYRQLRLTQSLVSATGQRLQLHYDRNRWQGNQGSSSHDDLVGADLSLSMPKHRFLARLSHQNLTNGSSALDSKLNTLNLDHYYTYSQALRVDSTVDVLATDRNIPDLNLNRISSTTDMQQLSSFAFWRPDDAMPLTVSGGLRLFRLSGDASSAQDLTLSGSLGGIYQYTKNLRFDSNASASQSRRGAVDTAETALAGSAYYESDNRSLWGSDYRYYGSTGVRNQRTDSTDNTEFSGTLGHGAIKVWRVSERDQIRLSVNQSGRYAYESSQKNIKSLDHSITLSKNLNTRDRTSYAQLSLSDSREGILNARNRQVVNYQWSTTHRVDRRQQFSGSFTVQYIRRQDKRISADKQSDTSASGTVDYRHNRLFNQLGLGFLSHIFLGKTSQTAAVDRLEWENRLQYRLGLLDTSASLRYIKFDSQRLRLIYFRVRRHF